MRGFFFSEIINRYYKPIQTEHFLCKLPLTFRAIEGSGGGMSDLIYLTCRQIAALCSIGDCISNPPKNRSLTISNRYIFLNYRFE